MKSRVADAVGGEAGAPVGHRLERLPGAHPPPLEALLEAREDPGQQRRAADQQHVVHVLDPGLARPRTSRRGRPRGRGRSRSLSSSSTSCGAREGHAATSPGAAPVADRPKPGGRDAEDRRLVEVHRLLHAAGLGQHQPPPEARVLVALRVERRVARLAAGLLEHPAVHRVAAERPALLREDARLARPSPRAARARTSTTCIVPPPMSTTSTVRSWERLRP